jgi:hypothetical protein
MVAADGDGAGRTVAKGLISPYREDMVTRLYSHPLFLEHLTPPGHPERPDRLRAVEQVLSDERFDHLDRQKP